MRDCHINSFYNEEGSGRIADIPDFPFRTAFSEGPEKILTDVLGAKAA